MTRFAFDLELPVLARHFRCERIFDAPVRVDHTFQSTIGPRAVFQIVCDTLTDFYRLPILRWHARAGQWRRSRYLEELPMPLGGD